MKNQETLEEANELVDLCNKISFVNPRERLAYYNGLKNGAKWQQEKMYSGEEVQEIISELMNDVHCGNICFGDDVIDFKVSPRQWFEQFKKK